MPNDIFLIDTSAWIFALRKNPLPRIKDRVDALLKENAAAIIGMIKLELLGGTKTEAEFNRLKSRLDALHLIEPGEPAWEEAARLAFNLRQKGVTVPFTAILIASAAIQAGVVLLHTDAHFDRMAGKSDLKAESLASFI